MGSAPWAAQDRDRTNNAPHPRRGRIRILTCWLLVCGWLPIWRPPGPHAVAAPYKGSSGPSIARRGSARLNQIGVASAQAPVTLIPTREQSPFLHGCDHGAIRLLQVPAILEATG